MVSNELTLPWRGTSAVSVGDKPINREVKVGQICQAARDAEIADFVTEDVHNGQLRHVRRQGKAGYTVVVEEKAHQISHSGG